MSSTLLFLSSTTFPWICSHLRKSLLQTRAVTSYAKDELVEYWLPKDDENAFLKEVLGKESMKWVHKQNDECLKVLGNPENTPLYNTVRGILDSKEKIPYVSKIQSFYYNFWMDDQNPRGLLRRTTLDSYLTASPSWEVVLDIDALGKAEGESWVYQGYTKNDSPGGNADRVLLKLSKGGSDASVVREFDLKTKSFVTENAFILPEAKSRVAWKSDDELIIGTDFGEGTNSLTDSGYPRLVKLWRRGTDFHNASFVFEGEAADVAVSGYTSRHGSTVVSWVDRAKTFYTSDKFLALGGDLQQLKQVQIPEDAEADQFQDQMLISLRKSWTIGGRTFDKGSLLAIPLEKVMAGPEQHLHSFTTIFQPTPSTSLDSYTATKDYLLLNVLDDVKTRIVFWRYQQKTSQWQLEDQELEAQIRGVSLTAIDRHESNQYWLTTHSFIQPSKLFLADATKGVRGIQTAQLVKQLTSLFNREGNFRETQFKAISKDGTEVPYFMIYHKDMLLNSCNPTILYGYGGFEISITPTYQSVTGASWLEKSFPHGHACYIVANIRGGGEYGPQWHQSALRENRQRAYDDFIAVAEDLIRRRITSSRHLGIKGGSNGGLLVGNVMVQRPDLFAAVHCLVPLLDMKAYNKLLAGASWMAEYGNPDLPEDWAFLQCYSAYHHIDPSKVKNHEYPALIMTTSTRDDRVHPYHARSFVKRIKAGPVSSGNVDGKIKKGEVVYYENTEGGHGGAADSKQQAFMTTLSINFFSRTLGGL